jgi:hypothetical protein
MTVAMKFSENPLILATSTAAYIPIVSKYKRIKYMYVKINSVASR